MYALRHRGQYAQAVASELDAMLSAIRAWLAVDHNEDGTHHVPVLPEAIPVGSIVMWGTNTAPERWLLCNGDAVSRTEYQGLYEIIGVTYGSGDGSTTFNVPDMRQRFPMGKAASGTGATLGAAGGAIDHDHSLSGATTGANGGFTTNTSGAGGHSHGGGTGFDPAQATVQIDAGGPSPVSVSMGPHQHTISEVSDHNHSVSVGDHTHTLGAANTDSENPPFVTVNFIILAGV